jgi:plastocyanin
MTRREFVAGLALLLGSASAGFAQQRRKPTTHTVTIEGMVFKPATLTIKPGDTVIWVNKDIVEHTATAEGKFDSKMIHPAKSWKHVFNTKGSFDYICRYHPTMNATLAVR